MFYLFKVANIFRFRFSYECGDFIFKFLLAKFSHMLGYAIVVDAEYYIAGGVYCVSVLQGSAVLVIRESLVIAGRRCDATAKKLRLMAEMHYTSIPRDLSGEFVSLEKISKVCLAIL